MPLYSISSIPWYSTYDECYYNTLSISGMPSGDLAYHVKRLSRPKLSPFETHTACNPMKECPFVIFKDPNDRCPIRADDYDWLLSFLVDNGYSVNYDMTKMIMKSKVPASNERILCFIQA